MSSLIKELYAILQEEPLSRKRLITGSYAQGHLWLERASREHGPVLHTESVTLEAWALGLAKLALAKRGLRYVSPAETKWIVCMLLEKQQTSGQSSYLRGLTLTPGLTDVIYEALLELRSCGIVADSLDPEAFESVDKGKFLRELLRQYESWLATNKLADWGGLAEAADDLAVRPDASMLIVAPDVLRSLADRKLMGKLSGGRYRVLEAEPSFLEPGDFPLAGLEFFHASGALAETREVMRRLLSNETALDEVEVIASDPVSGVLAVHTVMAAMELPCTFSDGLPIRATNAGKAALLYLDWLESGYQLAPMVTAFRQGVISLRDEQGEPISAARIIRELQQSGIGWGKERYMLLGKLAAVEGLAEERAACLLLLHRMFDGLLSPLDEGAFTSPDTMLRELLQFLDRHAVLPEEKDYEAVSRIRALQQNLQPAGAIRLRGNLGLRYVREAVESLRVAAEPLPKPGRLHVSSLGTGGQSGRSYTFITGMTEGCWSAAIRQNPVLLDAEKARLHPELPLSAADMERKIRSRNSRLGMIRGNCVMSYCSYDMAEQKEHMPAYELLHLYRRRSGERDADYARLHQAMGRMIAFAHSPSQTAADATELWTRALTGSHQTLRNGERLLHYAYPSLKKGKEAVSARTALSVSVYDGLVERGRHKEELPGDAGAGHAFSASMLERYGRCPLQYFFLYELGVQPNEEALYNRSQWLDASVRGSLLHGIFEQYLKVSILRDGGDDLDSLIQIAKTMIRAYEERVPAPSSAIVRKETASILNDVRIFYANEQKRGSKPVLTELRLHGDSVPLLVTFEGGWSLPLKGYVDRIDEIAPHRYKIYDYKTGNPNKFGGNECFAGGTQLQLPLYGLAAEQWMRQSGFDPEAEVVESSYLFPTEKGMGEEVSRPQSRRADLAALLQAITASMREGLFPPASDKKQCVWCDYRLVCGNHAELFAVKREAEQNAERLRFILEVSRYD
ncbi:PD-(D/E)XK nuclease family protein [Paenibacillus nanensis]|uniref:PD-(D/E)XK nuclease family protein n=1 Tax=Paenibacillus nanensis TaxID=393251 RepID=A0A3A1VJB6_9BACL|nr:PD-(D/E)XK nuclease family protein [Paenibacillus nanensis]RIX59716.1 PD-(D/E)XK nuclease family protein [Paenibacillus nanensis]